jgi:hypothetical protein
MVWSMRLSGVAVRADQVELLAGLLDGGELAAKLRLALRNRNDLVSLSTSGRARMVDVLADPAPSDLVELRSVLVRQLKQARDRETQGHEAAKRSACGTRKNAASRNDCYGGTE